MTTFGSSTSTWQMRRTMEQFSKKSASKEPASKDSTNKRLQNITKSQTQPQLIPSARSGGRFTNPDFRSAMAVLIQVNKELIETPGQRKIQSPEFEAESAVYHSSEHGQAQPNTVRYGASRQSPEYAILQSGNGTLVDRTPIISSTKSTRRGSFINMFKNASCKHTEKKKSASVALQTTSTVKQLEMTDA